MRYHLESTLPIHAFQPLVKHSPFKQGMTLEGGGGGGIVSAITDPISSALGTDGGDGGLLGALADVDKAVGDTVPGGWGTLAAVAVPYLAPEAMMGSLATTLGSEAAASAALAAGTSATTGAIQGKDPEDILKNAALAGGTSYGLNSLFGGADVARDFDYVPEVPRDFDYIPDVPRDFDYVPESSGSPELTPKGTLSPEEQFAKDNYVPSELRAPDYVEPTYIPSELNLGNLYQDMPDGATQLGYSPEQLASITSTPSALSQEEQYEKFYKEFLNNPQNPRPDFLQNPLQNVSNRASDAYDYLTEKSLKEMGSDLYNFAGRNKLELGLGALALSSMGGRQPQPQQQGYTPETDSRYSGGYGLSGGVADPYLLRERINASNIYNYRNPYTSRYAEGGEVKHFAFGGISNALTKAFQPIEKAVVQPVGQALPFLKDVAPYAGILAAPFIANPAMAVGVGSLSSGFGRPGSGFDMKRALMGGIAAYGASTLGAGVEAAGTTPIARDFDTVGPLNEAVSKPFFRDTDAMQRGVGNLLSSDSDAATKAFGTKASIFKSGVPLVMGTSGMMAIDEANKMREEADRSAGAGRQEQADMLARITAGRKRAEQAVRENPYMYAMGGSVDDEMGGDYTAQGMDQGNMQKGLFGMGYAAGGQIDMGNGYNPFANLPPMSGPLGAVGGQRPAGMQPMGVSDGFNPFTPERIAALNNDPQYREFMRVQGGGRDEQGRAVDGLGNVIERTTPSGQSFGQTMGGLLNMFPQSAEPLNSSTANATPQPLGRQFADNTQQIPIGSIFNSSTYQSTNMGSNSGVSSSTYPGGYGGSGSSGGAFPLEGRYGIVKMAAGGMPRFLSGGGDGMSDSIPATIEGTQEARLADGEFVISSDVVSGLGNGSSKAGAKQLYAMMDRVRSARTGKKKQAPAINPKRLMPA